jgi:iron(III) transport system substrate-binding protein
VYCSADSDLAKPVFGAFAKQSGIAVNPVFDTEATKTTGLVSRLLQEKERARADACWFSEPFGAIRLAAAGVLDDSTSLAAESQMESKGGWPRVLRDQGWQDGAGKATGPRWYGFGERARVVAYNTNSVSKEDAPTAYAMLLQDRFKGRIGMARPQFGTTRGHMAILADTLGRGPLGDLLGAFKNNDLRLYDGNGAVARAIGNGEIQVGLVDSDDVFACQREKWPIEMAFIKCPDPSAKRTPRDNPRWAEQQRVAKTGTILLPNTISRVRGGPNPKDAGALIDFLLSPETQRTFATSESRNIPVDPDLRGQLAAWLPPADDIAEIDFEEAAQSVDGAMATCDSVFG